MSDDRLPGLAPLVRAYETLTPAGVEVLAQCYAETASFKDPFNEVSGRQAIAHIFRHMYRQVDAPRFIVTGCFVDAQARPEAMLLWRFEFATRGRRPRRIIVLGSSHLRFDADGRVLAHRDYWDTAEELYAKWPLIGPLMRLLRRAGQA